MKPKLVSEKVKYKGPWFDIVQQDVNIGNGKVLRWEAIKTGDAVATVALDSENNMYLGKEYKVIHNDYIFTIASGFAENKTSEKDLMGQARKELREELGLNAKKFEKLAVVASSGRNNMKWHVYMARNVYPDPLKGEEGEFIKPVKVPLNKALNLLLANKCHITALLGVLLVKEKLKL